MVRGKCAVAEGSSEDASVGKPAEMDEAGDYDTTSDTYSVFLQLDEETTAVLAAVGVHRGGCEIALMRAVLPYIPQAIALQKMQKQQEYLSYHDDLTGLLNRNSFVDYLDHVKEKGIEIFRRSVY